MSRKISVMVAILFSLLLCIHVSDRGDWILEAAETSTGPYKIISTSFGAAGVEGRHGAYRFRGTVGQAVPGGASTGSGRLLYNGFWSMLLEGGYLPVPVELTYLTAERVGDTVVLRWAIRDASDLAGFHVYRQFRDEERGRVSTHMLSGLEEYEFEDAPAAHLAVTYWLQAIQRDGKVRWFGPAAVSPGSPLPRDVLLSAAEPNPFTFATAISYSLPEDSWVRLQVFDIQGRPVALLENGFMTAGRRFVTWDGSGNDGRPLSAGVYLLNFSVGKKVLTGKLVITR